MKCFSEQGDKVFAILNCRQRQNDDDAMVTMPLDTREYSLYQEMIDEGKDESEIFKTLFPPEIEPKRQDREITLSVSILNKRQLIVLITEELGISLPTLTRMSVNDLREMLLVLRRKPRLKRKT